MSTNDEKCTNKSTSAPFGFKWRKLFRFRRPSKPSPAAATTKQVSSQLSHRPWTGTTAKQPPRDSNYRRFHSNDSTTKDIVRRRNKHVRRRNTPEVKPSKTVAFETVRACDNRDNQERGSNTKLPGMDPFQKAALQTVLSRIDRDYGRASVVRRGNHPANHNNNNNKSVPRSTATTAAAAAPSSSTTTATPTGSLTLDAALGGGYPKGRIVEILGPESTGKTTLALHAIAECQKQGGTATFVDVDHSLDLEYAAKVGIDVENLYVSQPDCGEMALGIVHKLVESSTMELIVVDSLAFGIEQQQQQQQLDDSFQTTTVLQAQWLSHWMRTITSSLFHSNCTVILLHNPNATSLGNALKVYSSVRLATCREAIYSGDVLTEHTGIRITVNVCTHTIKSSSPLTNVLLDIWFGRGIDSRWCTLEAAVILEIVETEGSWYTYNGTQLAEGREKMLELLAANESLRTVIENKARLALSNYSDYFDEKYSKERVSAPLRTFDKKYYSEHCSTSFQTTHG